MTRLLPTILAVLLGIGAVAMAQDGKVLLPSRKAGMWDLTMQMRGRPDVTMQLCIDAKTDREMMDAWLSMVTRLCPRQTWSRQDGAIVIENDCTSGGRTVISRAELSGDFDSAHTLRVHTQSGVGARGQVDLMHTMRYVSEICTGGLIPGGVRLPNGAKMNMKRMMKLLENMNEAK